MLFDFNALRLSVCDVCAERKKNPTDSGRGLAVMHHQSACFTSRMAALVLRPLWMIATTINAGKNAISQKTHQNA